MNKINREALVPFSCEQMFSLVNEIESYSEFVPYCSGTDIISKTDKEVIAKLKVSKGSFEQSFTTKNINTPYSKIEMSLVDGPFKYLNGLWSFTSLSENAAKIELMIEFEFSNKLLGLAFGKVFNQLIENYVDAFVKRATQVYKTKL